jgi:hypothetical protein
VTILTSVTIKMLGSEFLIGNTARLSKDVLKEHSAFFF